ncbi:globin-coupled sensor protein [Natrialba aegyptia]|uniref:Methyl-accepting chemotaxis sensory transducer n=1 Tax=Natrialba aegyptia DSM 13077 TaxID=1227491 RepID=M0BBG8_9EURY|nr:globin-coupled sensor protein [Natrialba aegyptia]ELZ07633.1 methyl-accepting chemotaxis sensory transducer [Natrialba aegyptia DSM 13077]
MRTQRDEQRDRNRESGPNADSDSNGGAEFKIDATNRGQVDGEALADEIGLDRREIEWRKEFTGFGPEDADRLESMESLFDDIADEVVTEFYDHLQSDAAATAIIDSSSKSVEALKRTQAEYLRDLGRGEYGKQYVERRARIGKIHDMLDLGPKFYLGGYTIYYEGILDALADEAKADMEAAAAPAGAAETDVESGVENGRKSGSETGAEIAGTIDASDSDDPLVPLSQARAMVNEMVEHSLSALKLLNVDQQIAMDTYITAYADVEAELEHRTHVSQNVQQSVTELRERSAEVSDRSGEISELAASQSDAMGEISSEVAGLSATVEEIASNAEEVSATSERAEEIANDTTDTAEEAINKMGVVDEAADEVTADVENLRESVQKIDDIVDVINDIADQTNLLALNASIEAATAGEAGDGFAVVANEVKSLAEESQEEAKNIERMIDQIQDDTEETVESLETANDEIESGVELVEETVDNLERIEESVQEASTGIQEVATATDDQAASTEEVASMTDTAMDQSHEVADEIEAIVEQNDRVDELVDEIESEVDRLAQDELSNSRRH